VRCRSHTDTNAIVMYMIVPNNEPPNTMIVVQIPQEQ